ncbi:MAG: hypothetical protein WBP64_03680, partial [Nitrososphaeraceae archaeon]
MASKWSERKRSMDVLNVLKEWIILNGKSKKILHDNGKQFTSKIFRRFLVHNHDCSVWRRYGNTYEDKKKDKLGCTADKCDLDCEYYANEGVITDEQVHSWYKDEYGHFTEAEIKIL